MAEVKIGKHNLLGSTALRTPTVHIKFAGAAANVTAASMIDDHTADLTKILDRLHAKLSITANSPHFTPTGKSQQNASDGKASVIEIQQLIAKQRKLPAGHLESTAKAIAGLKMANWQDGMKDKGYSTDGTQSRLSEIRRFLNQQDPAVANALILEAAKNGDNEAILACQQCPAVMRSKFPLDGILERATAQFLLTRHPAEHTAHDNALNLLAYYDSNTKTALRNIMDSSGFGSQSDPMAEQAAAGVATE